MIVCDEESEGAFNKRLNCSRMYRWSGSALSQWARAYRNACGRLLNAKIQLYGADGRSMDATVPSWSVRRASLFIGSDVICRHGGGLPAHVLRFPGEGVCEI